MQHPAPLGLYDPRFDRDACGVGFVADLKGRASHDVLREALVALERLGHRGAVGADAHTGDGAGVLTQLPVRLFVPSLSRPLAEEEGLAVGMCFLPSGAQAEASALIDAELLGRGLVSLGWREVPVAPEALGETARACAPVVRQVLVARPARVEAAAFERELLRARKAIERAAARAGLGLYICSLSARTIVYKALTAGHRLAAFYPDLTDGAFETALAVFHQRFSTNTFPSWSLAQPFRRLGHNGEINTITGNRAWLLAREHEFDPELSPLLDAGGSDSASLDNALELHLDAGRGLPRAMAMLLPEAHEAGTHLSDEVRAFYEFQAGLQEPWDGPAAVAFSDGEFVGARLDRNGLRPARYVITREGRLVLGSEAGLIETAGALEKGRLGPGDMIVVDARSGKLYRPDAIREALGAARPFAEWLAAHRTAPETAPVTAPETSPDLLRQRQLAFGYTLEDVERLIGPMAATGKEAIGSMGDDTPLAVLSERLRPLYHFFKQRFAQVTNPPIDPLRERLVMSLRTRVGPRLPITIDSPEHARLIVLESPVLDAAGFERLMRLPGAQALSLEATFEPAGGAAALSAALDGLCAAAEAAARSGAGLLALSDRAVDAQRAPVPMLLAVSAVHHHLLARGLRRRCSLLAEAGDVREEHHLAMLLGFGCDAVSPYLALETAFALNGAAGANNYVTALEQGLRKILAKMGICTVSGYHGARLFEALGLAPELVEKYFPGTPARLSGCDLARLAETSRAWHALAFDAPPLKLPDLGLYRYRPGGEYHQAGPDVFKAVQASARTGTPEAASVVSQVVSERPRTAVRDLLGFAEVAPVPLAEVEPASAIARRFVACAMSLGALSPEAHACLAVAMHRLGGKSNSGEGGEDAARFGTEANSSIKQVASGRFGVTPGYLLSADELEIKMAQGSKPGEGGQLPGFKVNETIARLRHATPGVGLISPPPHHDIYSIEDLAQLIHDLKTVHPSARVAVKLVSEAGIGPVAAGVAKAHAEVIHVSGADGGTGASPLGSIKHAGAPWELGLAEAQQALVANGLRGHVRLRVDGGLKSGRDVVVAALLGAEEFGFGTALLMASGCVMARACHLNICPVGIATQDEKLRHRFKGDPDQIVSYLLGVAEEARTWLAKLGLRTIDEAVGQVELLKEGLAGYGLAPLLVRPESGARRFSGAALVRDAGLPARLVASTAQAVAEGGTLTLSHPIANTDRAVGAGVAGAIARRWGDDGFTGSITLRFAGSAGQSFGAFCLDGLRLELIGEANDYVGKAMAGGVIALRFDAPVLEMVLLGNTVLYGATGGTLYAAGRAGERFCVRNSGATAVVEGVGDHGCEYMTGGCVLVLGPTGRNFGAGMSGGVAYVLAPDDGLLAGRLNAESVAAGPLDEQDAERVRALLVAHVEATSSALARELLADWALARPRFRRVQPVPVPVEAPKAVRSGAV